jgi:hypothetical protein
VLNGGDKSIRTRIARTAKGLEIRVILHPDVEDCFKTLSSGETRPVTDFGRKWQSPQPLGVYDVPQTMAGVGLVSGTAAYRLDIPGREMIIADPGGLRVVNMSFIRLVGASGPEGVSFYLAGAFEKDDAIWLGQQIVAAGEAICNKYIYPVIINTSNTVREGLGDGI